ncbi:hypothetical protein CB1_000157005 [Camelus ferus]|nr:hypothetical protein CB1_000157005 [Camelus ferus]
MDRSGPSVDILIGMNFEIVVHIQKYSSNKEIVYNKLLPYAERLDAESDLQLAQIKSNLGRAVQLQELWPGGLFWTRKLSTGLGSSRTLVHCSSYYYVLPVERELCSATAEFEDFVLQFMDRCFGLIESSTLEQTREETETEKMTHLESLVELGLSSTFSTILTQCSKEIFMVALQKVFNFSISHIFETRVAGRMVADMCRAAVKDWGKPGDLWNLGIQWHVPSSEEVAFAFYLLDSFLQPELIKLQRCGDGELEMSRVPSMVSLEETKLYTGLEYDHILNNSEDDTKSLFLIIKIIGDLLQFQGSHKHEFDSRWKSFNLVKKSMENRLHGKKQHIRALLIDRVMLQHELRTLTVEGCEYKKIHQDMIRDLLRLSTSSYSQVRNKAQQTFFAALGAYNFCCRDIIPLVLEFLRPGRQDVTQQQFKGALYCLLGNHSGVCLASLHDWDCIVQTWPAIVSSGLSQAMSLEKPSIVRLFDDLAEKIHRQYETIGLDFTIMPSSEEIKEGLKRQQVKNADSLSPLQSGDEKNYENLVNALLDGVEQRNLPWKFEHIGIGLLSLLLRDDRVLPLRAIRFFVENLNHDAIVVRKMAISAVAGILKQLKRTHKKLTINPYDISGYPKPTQILAGDRPDNHWLHYDSNSIPRTKKEWESSCFVEKTHWGYYTWPHRLYVLQGGLAQQEWRVPELLHRLLKYLEPKLTQVYKNVRERIGSVLTYIFMIDVSLPNTAPTASPRVPEFTARILEKLKPLMDVDEEIQNHVMEENGIGEEDERTQGIKLLKTKLVKRHAGVLGLGACVLSSPYDVPTWMPQLLMNLSAHLNDPQPIEMSNPHFELFSSKIPDPQSVFHRFSAAI